MKDFFADYWIGCLVAVVIAAWLIDIGFSKRQYFAGTIIDKSYTPEQHSTGVGMGTNSSGQTGTVMTTHTQPERREIVVRRADGVIVTVNADLNSYYNNEIGAVLKFRTEYGLFTGWKYGSYSY